MPISYGQVSGRKHDNVQVKYDPENPKPSIYPYKEVCWSGPDRRGGAIEVLPPIPPKEQKKPKKPKKRKVERVVEEKPKPSVRTIGWIEAEEPGKKKKEATLWRRCRVCRNLVPDERFSISEHVCDRCASKVMIR